MAPDHCRATSRTGHRVRARALIVAATCAAAVLGAASAGAQTAADSARARAAADSIARVVPPAPRRGAPSRLSPPISAKRAFLYSLALPGYGQSRLDRGTSGALFSSIELAALVMVRRSFADVREARRYRLDTLPEQFEVVNGLFRPTGSVVPRFTAELVRARRLHAEDWLAVLAFNHLFSGADAFVAAQLWDVPVSLSAVPSRDGVTFVASVRW